VKQNAPISRPREYALLVVSGLALALAFPPTGLWPLAFVALVPLFDVLGRTRATGFWSAFRPGLVAGIAFFAPLLYWLVFLSSREMDNPVLMSGPLVLLVLLQSFYWGLFSAAAVLVSSRTRVTPVVALPILWVAVEQLRSLFVLGFTWGAVGYTAVAVPESIQFASVTGLMGVSFWIVAVNAIVLGLVAGEPGRRKGLLAGALAAVIALPVLHGALVVRNGGSDRTVRVAVIQPNITAATKWDPRHKDESFRVLSELTLEAAREDPDLVIWPETATPSYLLREPDYYELVAETARVADAPILTGLPDLEYVSRETGDRRTFNSALLVLPDGSWRGKYDKIHLVPFGEIIPFETVFPILKRVDFGEADFARGEDRIVFRIPEGRFSTLICFESIFPRLVRQFVDGGAEFLVNITNDVWYGRSSMPHQHASMAVMRAIENRRSLARSANSGVSLFADPHGRVVARTRLFERTFLVYDLPVLDRLSFYAARGDVFAWCVVALAGLLVAGALRGRREGVV